MVGFGLVRRSPGLAGLLAAQTISPLGDAMATTALILHVQQTTGSATAVGLLLFAQAIPPLAAPFAGVVADRFPPGRLLGAGWLAQAILAGLVAAAPWLTAAFAAQAGEPVASRRRPEPVGRCGSQLRSRRGYGLMRDERDRLAAAMPAGLFFKPRPLRGLGLEARTQKLCVDRQDNPAIACASRPCRIPRR